MPTSLMLCEGEEDEDILAYMLGEWGAGGGLYHIFEQKSSHSVFIEVHKQPQCTCQADTLAECNLTPSIALLVCPSGTTHSYEFTRSHK